MRSRITELSCKEVINICDGTRYGFVNDVEIDCSSGRIISLIVHCRKTINTIFARNGDIIIPWEAIKRIGDDLILVDFVYERGPKDGKIGIFSK
ncbi:MAG: YlmC/YmxH family sporulation protein [Oscillospiraceae bacterium]|nr:YlmC/YmxH family sporulation protein [Oscillospiraceae bacterium]